MGRARWAVAAFVMGLSLLPGEAMASHRDYCNIEVDIPPADHLICVRDLEWHLAAFCTNMERHTGLEAQTGVDWCPWSFDEPS